MLFGGASATLPTKVSYLTFAMPPNHRVAESDAFRSNFCHGCCLINARSQFWPEHESAATTDVVLISVPHGAAIAKAGVVVRRAEKSKAAGMSR